MYSYSIVLRERENERYRTTSGLLQTVCCGYSRREHERFEGYKSRTFLNSILGSTP